MSRTAYNSEKDTFVRTDIDDHYGLSESDAIEYLKRGYTVHKENKYYAFRWLTTEESEAKAKEILAKQKPLTPDECYSSPFTSDMSEQSAYVKESESTLAFIDKERLASVEYLSMIDTVKEAIYLLNEHGKLTVRRDLLQLLFQELIDRNINYSAKALPSSDYIITINKQ